MPSLIQCRHRGKWHSKRPDYHKTKERLVFEQVTKEILPEDLVTDPTSICGRVGVIEDVVEVSIGPMKVVFPTPDSGLFFSPDTDIRPEIGETQNWCLTLDIAFHFGLTPSRRRTLRKSSSRHPTLKFPFMAPKFELAQ